MKETKIETRVAPFSSARSGDRQEAVEPNIVLKKEKPVEPIKEIEPPKAAEAATPTAAGMTVDKSKPVDVGNHVDAAKAIVAGEQAAREKAVHVAKAVEPTTVAQDLPEPLTKMMEHIRVYSAANERDSKRDYAAFWVLQVPAIIAAAGAGVLSLMGIASWAPVLAFAAAIAGLIEAVNPRAPLRNAHRGAYNELQSLQRELYSRWTVGTLNPTKPTNQLLAEIITYGNDELNKISKLVREAETSLKSPAKGGK